MLKSDVIAYFEKTTLAAKALDLTPSAISLWGEIIPEKQALKLEKITMGALKYDLSLYQKAA